MIEPLFVSRFIAAKPENVWVAMTDRQDEWWSPPPWRCETKIMERKSGGRWYSVMHGPNGEQLANDGLMLLWEEGRRFVGTDAVQIVDGDYVPAPAFMIGTWSIEPAIRDGLSGTLYTASARHWSEEAKARHVDMGMVEGWETCAGHLARICEDS